MRPVISQKRAIDPKVGSWPKFVMPYGWQPGRGALGGFSSIMARPLLPARVRENMAKPPNHPVSRTLAKNQRLAVFVRKIGRQEQHHTFFISKNMECVPPFTHDVCVRAVWLALLPVLREA